MKISTLHRAYCPTFAVVQGVLGTDIGIYHVWSELWLLSPLSYLCHPQKSKVRKLTKFTKFTELYKKEIKIVWKPSIIKHNYEYQGYVVFFSFITLKWAQVLSKPQGTFCTGMCHLHRDSLSLLSLTQRSRCQTGNSDLGLQPSLAFIRPGEHVTHPSVPLL